ncbi:mitochondrial 54S ribosomal protein mL53 [Lipomyces oligophaga]|uniref:mitochondrial 54S ribosomal protein mL53 n=1 Tax=Lipomyces oligophaga TaxID=45792 RepID=UPI0034CDBEB8
MITKYITAATVRFDPLVKAGPARIFLSLFPPAARVFIKPKIEYLNAQSTKEPIVSVTFSDGKTLEFNPTMTTINGLVGELDRHSRHLEVEEQLKG